MVERMTLNHVVAGSIPAVGDKGQNWFFESDQIQSLSNGDLKVVGSNPLNYIIILWLDPMHNLICIESIGIWLEYIDFNMQYIVQYMV